MSTKKEEKKRCWGCFRSR